MRISNFGIKSNSIQNVRKNYDSLNKIQKQLTTGKKTFVPSDNPINAINTIYSRVRINQINQYEKNIADSKDRIDVVHDQLGSVSEVIQRVRYLAVQGANGIYNEEERKMMATEVDQLIREIANTANSQFQDRNLYGGSKLSPAPFQIIERMDTSLGREVVDTVTYSGDYKNAKIEINNADLIDVSVDPTAAFWGKENIIISNRDLANFSTSDDAVIQIDDQRITINEGETIDDIIQKINSNVSSVRATKEILPNGNPTFALTSNYPHQIQLQDLEGGDVLQRLGMITDNNQIGNNIHPEAIVQSGSIFDDLVAFRNSLSENNHQVIGTRDLGNIDEMLDNVLQNQAHLSSVQTRIDEQTEQLSGEKIHLTERMSKNEDVDIATASMEFSVMQNIHRISLQTAAKFIQPTLLDYL